MTGKKKIFIATGLYPPQSGGPATYTKLLEERLPARGFSVSVLPFSRVRHLPKGVRHVVFFLMCVGYAAAADVVYAQDTLSVGLPAALAAKLAGKKFLVRVPGDYAWEQGRQRYGVTDELDEFQTKKYGRRVERMRRLQKFVVRSARAVVVPSGYMQKIVSTWGVKPVLIYNGIEVPPAFELPKDRPEGFLVVTIARPVPWKGLEGLARVVSQEKSWHLKIVDGLPHAEAMGWVKAADVFVLNSIYEGLLHALIEAMALGTPVVATNVGGNPELVGGCGLLIPPKDDTALHAALKKIHDDPAAARERAAAAQARSREFTINKTLDKLCGLLKTL